MTTELRWLVDPETGSWVLQYRLIDRMGATEWEKIPVVFTNETEN